MINENTVPINHTAGSALSTTAAGMAGGAVRTGFKWSARWTVGLAVVGAVLGGVIALPALATLGTVAGAAVALGAVAHGAIWGVIGGGLTGFATFPFAGAIGTVLGGLKGGSRAATQVKEERGQAALLQAQVEAYKAQAASQSATTQIFAPSATNDNKFNFPAQGTAMNEAVPSGLQVSNDNMQYQGTVAGQQLAAAR